MNVLDFKLKKAQSTKISMITCYDYPSARILSESTIDCVLVGDSVAMVVHGHESTVMATLDMMVLHTKAVARGLKDQFLIVDLPFLCHRVSLSNTVESVRQLLQAGAQAVKIEGADDDVCHTISYLVNAGIPVMGHIGLTPQSVHQLGGFKVQGANPDKAASLLENAQCLEAAGCFAVVIECVPSTVAKTITKALSIPTIGIGAGSSTDGQVLVWHDLLGLQKDFNPKFVKEFTKGNDIILNALNAYHEEVVAEQFPAPQHSY